MGQEVEPRVKAKERLSGQLRVSCRPAAKQTEGSGHLPALPRYTNQQQLSQIMKDDNGSQKP